MLCFNPYYYWLVIFTELRKAHEQMKMMLFQSLLLLVSYFYKMKGYKFMVTYNNSFNPYYYWLVIFTSLLLDNYDTDLMFQSLLLLVSYFYMKSRKIIALIKAGSFNPYYYWLVIFTANFI